jgi:hypothetical protein
MSLSCPHYLRILFKALHPWFNYTFLVSQWWPNYIKTKKSRSANIKNGFSDFQPSYVFEDIRRKHYQRTQVIGKLYPLPFKFGKIIIDNKFRFGKIINHNKWPFLLCKIEDR